MIKVQLNTARFEYDIYSLVKAFFPAEDVLLNTEQTEIKGICTSCLSIEYLETQINFSYTDSTALIHELFVVSEPADRSRQKNELKRGLYDLLKAVTGRELPWGTLTGIRPIKIFMSFNEKNSALGEALPAAISAHMKENYYVSDEKIKLGLAIADAEQQLLEQADFAAGYSLYIGIPFCPTTCLYCSFTSYPAQAWEQRMEAYVDALIKELTFAAKRFQNRKLNTIYIGGGTPTTLSPALLTKLMVQIQQKFDLSNLLEYTVEAGRPDSITRAKLAVLKEFQVSRISINPQTMNQKTLDLIGRRHTVEETRASYFLARELGFDNINMDLIMGLPGETKADVFHTLDEIKRLNPDSLTVHSLAVKRASRLRLYQEENKLQLFNTQELMDAAAEAAKAMEMQPYYLYRQKNMAGNFENTGYAKAGKAGLYNVLMMEERQHIVAVGAGAISKLVTNDQTKIERSENVKDVTNYLDRIDEMIARKAKIYDYE